ncbi:MAG: VacJ family lipoprotein, partial [Pseudomonadota bacterium]|nr:VacJ family lipoprotein [Pseudomonadota bacterium]
MRGKKRRSIFAIRPLIPVVAAALLVSACAHTPGGTATDNDPYEATNRDIFAFNMTLDRAVARPVATFYVHAVPDPAREGVHNFLTNINLPVVFANDVLQGDTARAGQSLGRITVN